MNEELFQQVREDYEDFIQAIKPPAIMVFGSVVDESYNEASDLDICIISGSTDVLPALRAAWQETAGKYDIWIFEELPIFMQYEVLKNHEMIYCPDEPTVFEYLRPYQKLIDDYRYRLRVAHGDI